MVEKMTFECKWMDGSFFAAGEKVKYDHEDYTIISILEVRTNFEGIADVTALVVKS